MSTSTLTSKGQVTIPKRLRERLGLRVGDRLRFQIDADGKLLVQPESSPTLGRIPGLLRHLAGDRPITPTEMDEAIRRRTQQRYEKAVRR